MRWGNDGRCGSDYPLPDGTPAECDPGGLYPCCNQWGRCGGRTEDCACETCTDYRLRKWRVDGRCGSNYPLWDGTPSECEPAGGYPCCPNTSGGRFQKLVLDYCNCKHSPGDCVNYRAVQNIRKSGKSCAVTNVGGFLKYVCFDEDTRHFYYKCVYSEVYYQVNYTGSALLGVSEMCDEDIYAYQACGFNTNLTIDTIVFCGGYFCEQKLEDEIHEYVKCSGIDCGYCKRSLENMKKITKTSICSKTCNSNGVSNASIPLCDQILKDECFFTESDCVVHKNQMCDGYRDCLDNSDESHRKCKKEEATYPWNLKCPGSNGTYILNQEVCDGIESCDDNAESKICNIAKDFPAINTTAPYSRGVRDVCSENGENRSCDLKEYKKPWGYVFGEPVLEVYTPTSNVKCSEKFGEYYVFLSCLGLCEEPNITCPFEHWYNRRLQPLEANSCQGQYPERAYTTNNKSLLTFAIKSDIGRYEQNIFRCINNRCVDFKQVCNLVNDCGDFSDERGCGNHMICKNKEQHIAAEQTCDGIFDCSDLSDECNDSCGREILGSWMLKITCCFMGILAMAFNCISMVHGLASAAHDCPTENMLITKVLMSLIGSGDFLIGVYLIALFIYDSLVYGSSYCQHQPEWLTGTPCMVLGVISTVGSQVSLFSMTILSCIIMHGVIRKRMTIPEQATPKSALKATCLAITIIAVSLAIALTPLIPFLEDYFVQGMYYDSNNKILIGFPTKDKHIAILGAYYDDKAESKTSKISSDLTWREINEKVDGMFSKDHGSMTRNPVHFYGNDGVCLFKYFVRRDDARRSRREDTSDITDKKGDLTLWTMLTVNFACFVIITVCYIAITWKTTRSTQESGQSNNAGRLGQNKAMQNRIILIIVTDFVCWVPFIIISGMHNLKYIDASDWYVPFAMTVLPLNSVINPLVYDKILLEFLKKLLKQPWEFLTSRLRNISFRSAIPGLFRRRNEDVPIENAVPMEVISH